MKKKIIIIVPLVLALLIFFGLLYYYNHKDSNNLTIKDKKWISNNSSVKYDFEIFSDYPIFSDSGNGVILDFINDLELDTSLEFNKIAYTINSEPKTKSLRVRILNNDTTLQDNDLMISNDNYVLIGLNDNRYDNILNIPESNIGVFTNDVNEISYYLKTNSNLVYKQYDSIDLMLSDLENGTISYIIIPQMMYFNKTIGNSKLYINYYFTELSKKIVLTLTDDNNDLNKVIKKYYEKWKETSYVTAYNENYLEGYINYKKINDKTKASMLSKTYVYGYINNSPYEKKVGSEAKGIASEYIRRLVRLTNIDIEYKKYSNKEDLMNAINNKEVDFYFNDFGNVSSNYLETNSPFIEKYVVLKKNDLLDNVKTFEELKSKNVNMLNNNLLLTYMQANSKANISIKDCVKDLLDDDNLIIVDYEIYNYYKNDTFKKYEVIYSDEFTSNYTFGVLLEDVEIYNLFNYLMMTNSYYNYRVSGLNTLKTNALDNSTFQEIYLILLGLVLLPLLIFVFIYLFLKNRKKKINITKEDRRKYTDILTSLKNRNYLNLNIESWDNSKVYPQTIVMIDLNNIKYVNDNYGHEAGDSLIVAAASTLVNTQLENSEIIRTDGNEFLIYLVGYSEKQIDTYCKKLFKELKELPYGFGAAIGYSMITDEIKTIDDAINEATLDMQTNKEENNK